MENKELKSITIADNEAYLRQVSLEVNILEDKELDNDLKVLEKYCQNNGVLAMAAVQLGIPKRLVYLKNTNLEIVNSDDDDYNEARVLINPVVTKREGLTEYWEACASCLDNCGRVLRPYRMNVEYYDIKGNKHTELFEGFESTVLSHELDHLDGILHIDIAEEVLVMAREERKEWRKIHDYKVYFEDGKYELLKKENSRERILK